MNTVQKFLQFNGKPLHFLAKNSICWIAIKPICEVLNIDYIQQFKNLKADEVLGPELCKHTIQVPDDQARSMVCIPERYVYGWLLSIRSESQELKQYKK